MWIICIGLILLTFVIKDKYFEKLDKEEAERLKRDGHAIRLRSKWKNLVEQIVSISGLAISKERDDAVIIGETDNIKISIFHSSEGLLIAFVNQGTLIPQWKFDNNSTTEDIINKIYPYIKK